MVSDFDVLAFIGITSIASSILAFVIAFQAYRAYRFTQRRYLLNFLFGFLMLGVSYYLIAFGIEVAQTPNIAQRFEWPRLIVQSIAFALIASAYYTKQKHSERVFLAGLIALAAIAVPLVLTQLASTVSVKLVDQYFFLVNFILSLYVFGKSGQGYTKTGRKESVIVISGFGLLALSQYTWFIWAFEGGTISFLAANLVRLLGLILITAAFLFRSRNT